MDRRSIKCPNKDVYRHTLFDNSQPRSSRTADETKRYCVYFPVDFSLEDIRAKEEKYFEDDLSTWEYSAPVLLPSRSASNSSCNTSCSTPAQEIAMRFRAGMAFNFNSNGARRIPPSSSDSCSSEGFCDELDDSYVQIAPEGSCKPFPPISRIPALNDAYEEAVSIMRAHDKNDRLVCRRAGCRDTVKNVKDLTYHITVHNFCEGSYACPKCDISYEDRRQFDMHPCCRRRLFSHSSSALRESFRKILTRIISL